MAGLHFDIAGNNADIIRKLKETQKAFEELGKNAEKESKRLEAFDNEIVAMCDNLNRYFDSLLDKANKMSSLLQGGKISLSSPVVSNDIPSRNIEELRLKNAELTEQLRIQSEGIKKQQAEWNNLANAIKSNNVDAIKQYQQANVASVATVKDAKRELKGLTKDLDENIKYYDKLAAQAAAYTDELAKLKDFKAKGGERVIVGDNGTSRLVNDVIEETQRLYEKVRDDQKGVSGEISVQQKRQRELNAVIEQGNEKNLRTRTLLMDAREQLIQMRASGLQNTVQYQQAAEEVGKMRKQMVLVNAEMAYLANPDRNLAAVKAGLSGIASSASLVVGVMGLVNQKNEEMVQLQTKVQSLMGIIIGLEGTYNMVKKSSILMLTIENVQRKASIASQALEAKAKKTNIALTWAEVAAQKAFNLAAKANPYLILAVAIATVVGGIWLLVKANKAAENSTKDLLNAEQEMALARKSAISDSVKERTQLSLLYKKLKDTTVSTKERNAAVNEWMKKYPQHSNIMNGELVDLRKLESAYQSLSKQIIESAKARGYADKISELIKKREEADFRRLNSLNTLEKAKAELAKNGSDLQKTITENAQKQYNAIVKEVEDYDSKIAYISSKIKLDDLFPQPEKGTQEYWQQQVQIATTSIGEIKSEYLRALKAGTTTGVPEDIVKQYQDALKLKTEAEKELLAYDFKSTNGGSYNAILSQQEKVKDLLAKQVRVRIRYEEEMYDEIEQIRINSLNDGYNKTIAQMELNHEKELRAIDREKEDLLQKRRDEAKAVFNARQEELAKADKKYRKQTFDEETVSLSDEENTMFDERYKAQLDVQAKDTKDIWETMLKNYQDFDAKKAAIDKKYNEDVQSLQAEREKAEKAGNTATVAQIDRAITEAGKKRKEDLSVITLEEFKADINWADLFGNLDVLSGTALDNLRDKLKNFINSAASKLTPEDLRELSEALTNVDLTVADKSPYDVLKTSLSDYKQATETASKAQEKLNKLQKEGKEGTKEYKAATKELSDAERKRRESLKTMTQAANNIGEKGQQVVQAGSDIVDMLTSLGVSVPDSLSGALNGMGQVMSSLASIDLMKPMSILTGITGTLAGIGKTIGSLFGGKGNKAQKDTERLEATTKRLAETEKVINSFIEKRIELLKAANIQEQKNLSATTQEAINNQKKYYQQQLDGLQGNWLLAKKGKNNNLTLKDLGITSVEELEDFLSSERLLELQKNGYGIRDEEMWRKIIDGHNSVIESEKKLQETVSQNRTAITLDEAQSALDDFVRNADTSFEDVADSFEDYMRDAMFNIVKQNYLNKEMEKFYKDFDEAMSDGELSETESKNLRQVYENAYTNSQNMYDAALKAAGISAESNQESTRKAAQKGIATASQDSIDELRGTMTNVQGHTYSINENTGRIATGINTLTEHTKHLTCLADIDNTMQSLLTMRKESIEHLSNIAEYTSNLVEMKEFMRSMKAGIDTLNTKGLTLKR